MVVVAATTADDTSLLGLGLPVLGVVPAVSLLLLAAAALLLLSGAAVALLLLLLVSGAFEFPDQHHRPRKLPRLLVLGCSAERCVDSCWPECCCTCTKHTLQAHGRCVSGTAARLCTHRMPEYPCTWRHSCCCSCVG